MSNKKELEYWKSAEGGCTLELKSNETVVGRVAWISDYTVCFVPRGDQGKFQDGKPCLIYKSLLGVMTPDAAPKESKHEPKRAPRSTFSKKIPQRC